MTPTQKNVIKIMTEHPDARGVRGYGVMWTEPAPPDVLALRARRLAHYEETGRSGIGGLEQLKSTMHRTRLWVRPKTWLALERLGLVFKNEQDEWQLCQ